MRKTRLLSQFTLLRIGNFISELEMVMNAKHVFVAALLYKRVQSPHANGPQPIESLANHPHARLHAKGEGRMVTRC